MHKYTYTEIEEIWNDDTKISVMENMWLKHLEWMHSNGFDEALQRGEYTPPNQSSQHEVIDALRIYVGKTGYVNAHAGLTSSDIVDNVRLWQCAMSINVTQKLVSLLIDHISKVQPSNTRCVGYTHWRPAAHTTMGTRFEALVEPLIEMKDKMSSFIPLPMKRVGGATGTRSAMAILCGKMPIGDPNLSDMLAPSYWDSTLQSGYHLNELECVDMLCMIAAQAHKISQDFRFLIHTGEITLERDTAYRGSSSMPNKINPIEFERVCSLLRLVPSYYRAVWDAMAFNGLERTLDTSAILRVALPDAFNIVCYCINELIGGMSRVCIDEHKCAKILAENKEIAYSEDNMAHEIANGKSRMEVYEKQQQKQ